MENQESTQAENNSSTAVLDDSENNIEISSEDNQSEVLFVEEKLVSNMEIKSTKSFDSIILVSKYEHSFLKLLEL